MLECWSFNLHLIFMTTKQWLSATIIIYHHQSSIARRQYGKFLFEFTYTCILTFPVLSAAARWVSGWPSELYEGGGWRPRGEACTCGRTSCHCLQTRATAGPGLDRATYIAWGEKCLCVCLKAHGGEKERGSKYWTCVYVWHRSTLSWMSPVS